MCKCDSYTEIDSKRIWNPVTCNVEFRVWVQCNSGCGRVWEFSNLGVY